MSSAIFYKILSVLVLIIFFGLGYVSSLVKRKADRLGVTVDDHAQKITVIDSTYVSKDDLDQIMTQFRRDINTSFDRMHQRIDAIYTSNGRRND